jgi:hypothetical protein
MACASTHARSAAEEGAAAVWLTLNDYAQLMALLPSAL